MKYGKKELEAIVAPLGNHYVLSFVEGGELPMEFRGLFTSPTVAYQHAQSVMDQGRTPASNKE